MRTEMKIGIVVALVGIAAFAFWMARSGDGLEKIPIDKSAMDAAGGADFAMNLDAGRSERSGAGSATPTVGTSSTPQPAGRARPDRAAPAEPLAEPQRPALRVSPPVTASERTTSQPSPAAAGAPGDASLPPAPALRHSTSQPAHSSETASPPAGSRTDPTHASPSPQSAPTRIATDARGTPGDARPPVAVAPPRSAEPSSPARDSARESAQEYTIQPGDTLIAIADAVYGDESLWAQIKAANPGVDENRLLVGKKLVIPPRDARRTAATPPPAAADAGAPRERAAQPAAASRAGPSSGRATYVVGDGDSLIKIARNVLKDASRWREIYELNRDKLRTPDHVEVGMELRLPPLKGDGG